MRACVSEPGKRPSAFQQPECSACRTGRGPRRLPVGGTKTSGSGFGQGAEPRATRERRPSRPGSALALGRSRARRRSRSSGELPPRDGTRAGRCSRRSCSMVHPERSRARASSAAPRASTPARTRAASIERYATHVPKFGADGCRGSPAIEDGLADQGRHRVSRPAHDDQMQWATLDRRPGRARSGGGSTNHGACFPLLFALTVPAGREEIRAKRTALPVPSRLDRRGTDARVAPRAMSCLGGQGRRRASIRQRTCGHPHAPTLPACPRRSSSARASRPRR